MKKYNDLSGNSGIEAYHVENSSITVKFKGRGKFRYYIYDHEKPGIVLVNKMKSLASAGAGLSTFISRYVRGNFRARL